MFDIYLAYNKFGIQILCHQINDALILMIFLLYVLIDQEKCLTLQEHLYLNPYFYLRKI